MTPKHLNSDHYLTKERDLHLWAIMSLPEEYKQKYARLVLRGALIVRLGHDYPIYRISVPHGQAACGVTLMTAVPHGQAACGVTLMTALDLVQEDELNADT
jgi:hypothetical protein